MSTKQGYIKNYGGDKMLPQTTSTMVTDVAKEQALSATLANTPDKNALGYPAFSTVTAYSTGDKVYYNNKLWVFTADHAAGAWNAEHVTDFDMKDIDDDKADKVEDAHNGNLAGLDANGNLTDSGIAADNVAQKNGYYAGMAVGLADNLRGKVYADEQFSLRMTGGEANEVGGIGVVQVLKGAGAAIVQMFPEGAGHDFSGDVSLDGTGGNAEAVVRYSNDAGTLEMGYLLCLEAFVSQTLTQTDLNDIDGTSNYYPLISPNGNPSTKYYEKNSTTHAMEMSADTSVVEGKTYFYPKADRDKAVWLTPAGAITSAPTIESGQTEVTFSGWRIAMRVKASEVRDSSASTYWFTAGTTGRQVYDVAVAEGIDLLYPQSNPADW